MLMAGRPFQPPMQAVVQPSYWCSLNCLGSISVQRCGLRCGRFFPTTLGALRNGSGFELHNVAFPR